MDASLSTNQREYVWMHFNQSYVIPEEIKEKISYSLQINEFEGEDKIIFRISEHYLDNIQLKLIDGIPVIFAGNKELPFYSLTNNSLIFHHDLLKSAFYLLSGYQEYKSAEQDHYGRFPYKASLQHKYNFIDKPIVNYYFEIIAKAINEFSLLHGYKKITEKKHYNTFGFYLTHDIDNIDYYTFNHLLYKLKQLVGLAKNEYSLAHNLKDIGKTIVELLKFNKKRNPDWSFAYLRELEQLFQWVSAFYFLHKDIKNQDSRYVFTEKRMQALFAFLENENCEIGIHGSVASAKNAKTALIFLQELQSVTKQTILGGRQHRLIFKTPDTSLVHQSIGLKYDSSLGFAEHEGFRNSYCLPFKLYDFENDKPVNVWQIPLIVMDGTLFYYRRLSANEAFDAVEKILYEIKHFNGLFTLLWHNDFFDEARFGRVKQFYEGLLKKIYTENPENVLGHQIIAKCLKN